MLKTTDDYLSASCILEIYALSFLPIFMWLGLHYNLQCFSHLTVSLPDINIHLIGC